MKSLKAWLQSFNLPCFILFAWHHDGQHSGNLDFIFGHCQPDLGRHEVGYLDFILIPAFLIFLRCFFRFFSNTSYPNEIYFSNLTLHKLHWASPKSTTTTTIWFQTEQMAWWFCMSGCKNILESWVRTQHRTCPTQSPQTFHCRVSWDHTRM